MSILSIVTISVCPPTGPPNVDKHLKIVRAATWEMRTQWYDLGVELGINVETLKVSSFTLGSPVSAVVGALDMTVLFLISRQLSVTAVRLMTASLVSWRNGCPLNQNGLPSLKLSSHPQLDVKILLGTLKLSCRPQLDVKILLRTLKLSSHPQLNVKILLGTLKLSCRPQLDVKILLRTLKLSSHPQLDMKILLRTLRLGLQRPDAPDASAHYSN